MFDTRGVALRFVLFCVSVFLKSYTHQPQCMVGMNLWSPCDCLDTPLLLGDLILDVSSVILQHLVILYISAVTVLVSVHMQLVI